MSKNENIRLCGPGKPGNSSDPMKKIGKRAQNHTLKDVLLKESVFLVSRGKQSGQICTIHLFVLGEKELDIDRKRERREREKESYSLLVRIE